MSLKITKYSKKSDHLLKIKNNFFLNNSKLLNGVLKENKLYTSQNKRLGCKNCGYSKIEEDFTSFGVKYGICKKCGHINGLYEDSEKFVNYLYSASDGDNYKENYLKDYDERVKTIYIPKVNFLSEVIKEKYYINDIGCGGGHFVKACEDLGIKAEGIDTNKSLIELGMTKLKSNKIILADINSFENYIRESTSVVSMIGVLEHLREPHKALESFIESKASYLYISVPLFSLSVFIEHVFPDVFPRHLRGPHTHLYTEVSLDYLTKKYNLEIVGEWWFGLDFMDLYRSLKTKMEGSKQFYSLLDTILGENIDDLQNVLDKKKVCSEVHLVLKKSS